MGSPGISLLLLLLLLSLLAELPLARAQGRPGYCPELPIPYSSPYNAKRRNNCQQDTDCPVGQKCCGSRYGNICQFPETDRCRLPPVAGHCLASYRLFYYNWKNKRCEMFIYGGCYGNANRFDTLELCQLACGSSGAP